MNWLTLKTEIATDPLARYSGLSDAQIAASLNAPNRTRDRSVIPAYEIIDATVPAEWATLTSTEKQRYQTLTGAGEVNAKSANTRSTFLAMFAAGTTTRANLSALQTESISRATELGLPEVHSGDVAYAKIT